MEIPLRQIILALPLIAVVVIGALVAVTSSALGEVDCKYSTSTGIETAHCPAENGGYSYTHICLGWDGVVPGGVTRHHNEAGNVSTRDVCLAAALVKVMKTHCRTIVQCIQ